MAEEKKRSEIRVLYVGDVEAFQYHATPGLGSYVASGVLDESIHLRSALASDGAIEVTHMGGAEAMEQLPQRVQDFQTYDVAILSDVIADSLLLYRDQRSLPPRPNRLVQIRDYVAAGGGLMMIGGWFSFGGLGGQARFHDTPIEEALPVAIKDGDDRCELPEGCSLEVLEPEHPLLRRLPSWEEVLFAGYNRLTARPEAEVLARTSTGDPLLVVGRHGQGRTCAFAADCAPGWAGSMLSWAGYSRFWCRLVRYLAGEDS